MTDLEPAEAVALEVVEQTIRSAMEPLPLGTDWDTAIRSSTDAVTALITKREQAARAEEREACMNTRPSRTKMNTKLWGPNVPGAGSYECGWNDGVIAYAEAIRARTPAPGKP